MAGYDALSAKQEVLRARLATGCLLSSLPSGHEWRLHEPDDRSAPEGGSRLHFMLGRGLLRRGLLREVQRWSGVADERRLYALVHPPEPDGIPVHRGIVRGGAGAP